jgi:molybdate transport system ATP-binding protein
MKADVHGAGIQLRLAGRFGGFRLDCTATIPDDGVTALVGASGSGKTTLLRCLAGLCRAEGYVCVDGAVWQDDRSFLPAHRRGVCYVFQESSLLPHLSVRENLHYALRRAADRPGPAFEQVVDMLGVGALLSRSPKALSGGERQRVAIARTLLARPRLLLMDEPLSSLDAASKAEVAPYLEQLAATLKLPILYVSHDTAEVRRLADRVLWMQAGRIVEPPEPEPLDAHEQRLRELDPAQVRALALAAMAAGLRPPPASQGS